MGRMGVMGLMGEGSRLRGILGRFGLVDDVRRAGGADVGRCVEMALEDVRESGLAVSEDAGERLAEHFLGLVGSDSGGVFVAGRDLVRGMVCCALTEPEAWDSRPVASVWFLYVRPEFRKHPGTALGLMRAALSAARSWGAERIRIVVDAENRRLVDRYERRMGFRREMSYGLYSLEMEE